MPECMAVYKKYAESYEKSWARKIVWAYKKLKQEKGEKSINWSDLRRLSGVKRSWVNKFLPYLEKYAEEGTQKIIRAIVLEK